MNTSVDTAMFRRLGKSLYFSPDAHARYVSHFGHTNRELSVANHTLILFDAANYADEDSQRHGQKKTISQWTARQGGSLEYVRKFAKGKSYNLLSRTLLLTLPQKNI